MLVDVKHDSEGKYRNYFANLSLKYSINSTQLYNNITAVSNFNTDP